MGREDIVKSIHIRIYIVLPLYSFLSSLSSFFSIQSIPYSIESVRIISIGIRAKSVTMTETRSVVALTEKYNALSKTTEQHDNEFQVLH